MKQKPKTCEHCGEEFTPERRNGIYCSQTCRQYSYLSRKTGEVYGLPKKENGRVDFSNVPALIIEEDEKKESISVNKAQICRQSFPVNYQLQRQKESTKNVNWNNSVDVNSINQPSLQNQPMKTELHICEHSHKEEEIPVLFFNNDALTFLEDMEMGFCEEGEFVRKKPYPKHLEEQKRHCNSELASWSSMPLNVNLRSIARSFGQRIRPFLESLLSMDGQMISIKSLHQWKKEAQKVWSNYFPDDRCPGPFAPVDFFGCHHLVHIEECVATLELMNVKTVILRMSDYMRSKAEIALRVAELYPSSLPEKWLLP
jgi:hypothetical protein